MAAASGDPRFDTGRLCLDLVATAAGPPRGPGDRAERLDGPERLGVWLVRSGLVPPGTALAADQDWLDRFRELRELLRRLVRAQLDGAPADPAGTPGPGSAPNSSLGRDLDRLNALAAPAPSVIRAVPGRDGTLVRALAGGPGCAALLSDVARDAIRLLTDPVARGRLRECEGDSCSRVYLDTSRGRRRRWCSSEICGNRERVARHRRRSTARRSRPSAAARSSSSPAATAANVTASGQS
ncbi:CGNR zinc finger domain-containing protein [Streptomyces sp. WAC 00631]|uniref:CGNR zinc finger domain-containing protein n=1 Tax=Streptomyces sp. WAC 00631 TaxID=2203201 RepID=UPI000F7980DB|nr:CGNR zinc finger domain-containing protein [Streptomyces sp. WAC 00631]MCC5033148.1 CGNR zinc finger domain-containing protein [Streptomyces sp. WAC 00631]